MKKDNRVHPRLLVRLPGEFRVGSATTWQRGTVHDLSAGGATLLTVERVPPQTVVRLRVRLPEEGPPSLPPIEIETLVLRSDPLPPTGGNTSYREALYFLDLVGESYERVRRFVFERLDGAVA